MRRLARIHSIRIQPRFAIAGIVCLAITSVMGCATNARPAVSPHARTSAVTSRPTVVANPAEATVPIGGIASDELLEAAVGKRVELQGPALNCKAGAAVDVGRPIYVTGWNAWPRELRHTRVTVTGRLSATTHTPEHVDEHGVPTDAGIFGRIFFLDEAKLHPPTATRPAASTRSE